MPHSARLSMAALNFAKDVLLLKPPAAVLHQLDQRVAAEAGLDVLCIWRVPLNVESRDLHDYVLGKTIFVHHNIKPAFWEELSDRLAVNGPSPVVRMAMKTRTPFTLTEAMQQMRPTGADRWGTDLLAKHGIRDALFCPNGDWIVSYRSKQVIKASPYTRCLLNFAAAQAAWQIEHLVWPKHPMQSRKMPVLSAQELAVIRWSGHGHDTNEIADKMHIKPPTVRTHLGRARRKLHAKTTAHAVAISMRYRLIPGMVLGIIGALGTALPYAFEDHRLVGRDESAYKRDVLAE